MDRLVEQLDRRRVELQPWLHLEQTPPALVRILRNVGPAACEPDFDAGDAPSLTPDGDWREPVNTTVWLRFRLRRPEHWAVQHTALVAERFGTYPVPPEGTQRIGLNLQRLQGLLYVDGHPYHGLDQYHRLIYLPPDAVREHQFAASVWTGFVELDWQPNPIFRLVHVDPGAMQLHFDLVVLADALRTLAADDPARPELEQVARTTLRDIEWSAPGSQAFRSSLGRAHATAAEGFERLRAAPYAPSITAVGHAHIDCAWLWPMSQTREKAGRTWATVLRLMERYPEYRFLASTPLQYAMVKEDFPETFAGIRARIADGRWELVGGMWVEADCNLPDGESLARQMLVGTRYFEHEFGIETTVVWLPDTFGFTWALPTLMAAAGLRYFVTHKLSWSDTNRIPHDTFRWRGPDGSDVLAHFLCTPSLWPGEHTTYNGTLLPSITRGAWQRFADRDLQRELLVAFGYGDGGGGPSLEMLEAGRRLTDLPGFPRVDHGRASAFFARLSDTLADRTDVPVWDGELYLEYHRGTYTGQARQKLRNAQSQRLYHAAELYASMARALLGADYPYTELNAGWRLILTNQFHDILPGSAISAVYVDAERDFQRLRDLGNGVLETAMQRLAGSMQLAEPALVVFNPAPFAASEYVEVPADCRPAGLPSQALADGRWLVHCSDLPANGYRAFPIRAGAAAAPAGAGAALHASPTHLDTPFWQITFDATGRITRLWDKLQSRDVVPAGRVANHLVVFEDRPLNYDAWDIDAFHATKWRAVDALVSATVRESGPERAVLELEWQFGERTRITQRVCVYARSPRIDFVTHVDWHARQALLRVGFATGIRNRRATFEIQFGSIDRPTHRNTSWEEAAFEVPAQRWVDLSDAQYGVALLADCKHGYSVQTDTLWLSLLKGAIDPDPAADRGEHEFTYALLPHAAGLDVVRRAAYGLTRPPLWRRESAHAGQLPSTFSLADTTAPGVIVETAKWAEDEDALVLRAYEADGGATRTRLHLGVPAEAVDEVDLLERHPRPVVGAGITEVPLEFRACEIKTVRVRGAGQGASIGEGRPC